jgi:hypothetical protein
LDDALIEMASGRRPGHYPIFADNAANNAEFASNHLRAAAGAILMPGQTWTPEAFPRHPRTVAGAA